MASSLPPVRGAAFTFYVCLVSQADTDIFKTSPTLAAGDITVSKDGGDFANITTLPTQVQSTGVLPVALTATEMTADVVVVRFHDAAGDEWQDALVTIYTAAQTLDTTDGVADDIKATVNHVTYGNSALATAIGDVATVDEILDEVVEGALTMRQVLRVVLAVLAGKATGGGTTAIAFRDQADALNRVLATVDGNGNRTAVTLDVS